MITRTIIVNYNISYSTIIKKQYSNVIWNKFRTDYNVFNEVSLVFTFHQFNSNLTI